LSLAIQSTQFFAHLPPHEWPGNVDFLKPWLRGETRKGSVAGQEVEYLHPLGKWAVNRLFNSSPEEIPKYDLAEMNLICAYGLTGKHDIEIEAMLRTLDSWADRVAEHTRKRINLFHRNRERFGTLERFRVTAMSHVLTTEFNVHYNPDRVTDPSNWDDHEDAFIHGLLGPRRHGTCASLPVLLAVVGRRLGYPIKLITVANHCLCRWDSPDERFNIEYEHGGLNSHPDEYYTHWPHEWTPEVREFQRKRPCWLISLSPQQDLAYCVHTRALQLSEVGRYDEAWAAQIVAYKFWPHKNYAIWSTHFLTKKAYRDRKWPRFPCEETAGKAACERLIKEKGAPVLPPLHLPAE
jgi:hypothetical protein